MGRGGTGGTLSGLLPLDMNHPNSKNIFRAGNIEEDYDIEKEPIARGKFASVRLARHRTSGELFAAKYVRRRRRAANLEDEARHEIAVLLLGRSTPHIVHLHQVFETRSEYVIVLEFGEGGDLQRLLDDRGRLEEKTVRDLLRQILNGLGFLHQKRVAHLDIKPQNLVLMGLTPEEGVKLVDFGLSRVIHEDTELTQIMGTPDYVAPEVINFEAVGLATDMWSIGVLTYVLLSGYTPFGGDTDQETFVNITQGEFDFPDEYFGDTTEQAKDFISGLLLKSPNQRLTVKQCAAHPWLSDLFDPHRLSQLSEADSADSGYSTDLCSGSPPSPGMLSNGYASDLCHYSIPEDQQIMSTPHPHPLRSFDPPHPHSLCTFDEEYGSHILPRLSEANKISPSERRPRLSSGQMSVNVLEAFQDQQQRAQSRPLRRSSLVIPRHADERGSKNNETSYFHYDENQNKADSFYIRDKLLGSKLSASTDLTNWNHREKDKTPYDQSILLNLAKPWNNLCYGSYNRALNQLNSPSPKKAKPRTNLGIRPELSCSMFELKPSADYHSMMYSEPKPSKYDLRKSKSELRGSKRDLRVQNLDLVNPEATELRNSKNDLRTMKFDLDMRNGDVSRSPITEKRYSKSDLKNSKHDLKFSRTDQRNSKSDLRNPKPDLRKSVRPSPNKSLISSQHFASIPYLNMSLSRLDIAHETLDEASEERDIVPGDCTLPRRFSRSSAAPLFRGNSFHMSFRKPKKRDDKI